jgi:hypothetical protein
MGKMSRKERKLTKSALKNMDSSKKKSQLMSQDPVKSYKRKIVHTEIPWPLELIQIGRTDILVAIILLVVVLTAAIAYGLYLLINWIIGMI